MLKKSVILFVFVFALVSSVTLYFSQAYSKQSTGSSEESGRPAGSQTPGSLSKTKELVEHQPNDGIPAKTAKPARADLKRPEADVTKHPALSEAADVMSVSQRLLLFDREQRENSLIELEAGRNLPENFKRELESAESLWNRGEFDSAINKISLIEQSGIKLALGIQWKTPRTEISANWAMNDSRIGARINIDEACLDFDAQSGNQFAVLRYNASSTGYWTVNISKDNGKTWQETYQWNAESGKVIRDVSAAVVGDFLWVGYVGAETLYKEGRMRRFSVNDGSSDSTYSYKTVIDKDAPIKEISLIANADNYDNRLYYSAILDRSSPLTSVAEVEENLPITTKIRQEAEQQQIIESGDAADMLQQLSSSPKLSLADRILGSYKASASTSRVIVNLRDPSQSFSRAVRSNFQDDSVKNEVTQQVAAAQSDVIDALDQKEVHITNRFTYIFGFSAEVSLAGLVALVNNPDVVSIEEDKILVAHLAQGIPLMNATAARDNHSATGMSIAICDTGINYNHPMLGNGGFPNSKVIGGYDTGENDADPMDGNGHGTACAGIAAGTLGTSGDYIGGVAYGAKLYALKMTYTSTNGSAYTADMIEAWEWCITHRNDDPNNPIMIISTSFGGDHFTSQASCDASAPAMATAAANAKAAGITIFVSTGNDGFCDGTAWPGCLTDVISVGAVYDADIGRHPEIGYVGCISTLSCAGYTSGCGCSTGKCYVDETTAADQVTTYSNSASFMSLFAPSNNASTTALGSAYRDDFGGTSAACPYAAGSGAVLQSTAKANSGAYLTPDQVKSILIGTGDSVTDSKVSITKPRVNLGNAVASIAEDNLVFFWGADLDTATPIWYEVATGVTDALKGLDATWNKDFTSYFCFLSYISSKTDNPVVVLKHSAYAFEPVEILSAYTGGGGATSISAYNDTVICAYEHSYSTSSFGVRYNISYDAGNAWNFGTFEPDSGHSYWRPDVTARGGQGTAIVFSDEAGDFDPVRFYYRNHYSAGPWDTEIAQINRFDNYTGTPNTIDWLPPRPGKIYNYGIIYLSEDPDYGTPYFDRSDAPVTTIAPFILPLLLDE
jgi:subtilisin family serine protease